LKLKEKRAIRTFGTLLVIFTLEKFEKKLLFSQVMDSPSVVLLRNKVVT